jgi:hypothetical protein
MESRERRGNQLSRTAPRHQWPPAIYLHANICLSPLRVPPSSSRRLALMQIGKATSLRDTAEAFGRKVNAPGLLTTTAHYSGIIHDSGCLTGGPSYDNCSRTAGREQS